MSYKLTLKEFCIVSFMFLFCFVIGYSQNRDETVNLKMDARFTNDPDPTSKLISILPKGTTVTLLSSKNRHGTYGVRYGNKVGYIGGFELGKTQQTNYSQSSYDVIKLKMDTRFTNDPDPSSKLISTLRKGTTVKLLSSKNRHGTYGVRYGNKVGFIGGFELGKTQQTDTNNKDYSINRNSNNLPPILSITSVDFSEKILDGNEDANLRITVKNLGPGDAYGAYVNLSGYLQGLEYPIKSTFSTIKANGGTQTISINISGGLDLPTSQASLKIEIVEPFSKVKIQGKELTFPTREFQKPNLILAQYNVIENQSADPNKQIDINEIVDLKFAIQNIGEGNAKNVKVDVTHKQNGVVLLGVVKDNTNPKIQNLSYSEIFSGKFETITYRYFINSDFTDSELKFIIKATESTGKYGFFETKLFPINTELQEVGYIRTIAQNDNNRNRNTGTVKIEDIPDFVVDVDTNIPLTSVEQNNTYALIIGNEDYSSKQTGLRAEQNADFAVNDALIFSEYCKKTLGIPSKQVRVLKNATSAQISQNLAWINNLSKIEKGNAKLIFYYSGHGLPDEQTKEPYLVPVDVSGSNLRYGIKTADVYKNLTEHPAKQVTVFLDACFSGGARNQGLLAVKGVKVKPKSDLITGNMVVFSSSSGDESSAVYKEKQHGYFTYYLLKKLQETKGQTDLNTLGNYVINSVSKEAGLNGKIQTPEVNPSLKVENDWQNWKLK